MEESRRSVRNDLQLLLVAPSSVEVPIRLRFGSLHTAGGASLTRGASVPAARCGMLVFIFV